jgi:two-component system NtrC family sensor kinase
MINQMLTQGLLAITFFKASAFVILLVFYLLLYRELQARFLRIWLVGWALYTCYAAGQIGFIMTAGFPGRFIRVESSLIAGAIFIAAVLSYVGRPARWQLLGPALAIAAIGAGLVEYNAQRESFAVTWVTALLEGGLAIAAGWILWRRMNNRKAYGPRLLAAAFFLSGLHNLDRPLWVIHPMFQLRIALSDLFEVAIGVAMAVVILETTRARNEELNDKLRRLTLITAASTQSFDVQTVLSEVLRHLVASLNASHGVVRLLEGEGEKATLVIRAAVGFSADYLEREARISAGEPWPREVLNQNMPYILEANEDPPGTRQRMREQKLSALALVRLPGKDAPLGVIGVGSNSRGKFQSDELQFLINVANLLGLTIQNVSLFEQVANAQKQWAYTFDSIDDPVLVHDAEGRVLRANHKLSEVLGKTPMEVVGRTLRDLFRHATNPWNACPYCENVLGLGKSPDPNLGGGYFLASSSAFHGPGGARLGTVHVLKDITERKRAEERYRNLIENAQEGVFISTPEGRFLDFNDAFLRMMGYESREELLNVEIAPSIYVNPSDRERLKKLLREHGAVNGFEFQMRRRDGEILTLLESSFATRDASGKVTAYQGFVLDITERKKAEQEIRRRNRELLVLNSIAQTLSQSCPLSELLRKALSQVAELFAVDLGAIYLLDEEARITRRVAEVGHKSEYARAFPPTQVSAELIENIRQNHATVLSVESLPLPPLFRDLHNKEGARMLYGVVLWSKDRILGGMVVGCRTVRDFSAAELNLLNTVGSQIAAAVEKSLLLEETQQAYQHLRCTQEQLLQSAKMAAVGQLISGVAHELNNPLTAILGYSQLLTGGNPESTQARSYVDKIYRQAQRTQRIVQNLLSFARQEKPERQPVDLNQVLEDTLTLRDYDLRVNNIEVHREFAPGLPLTTGDAHQLQQVFLNILNNAVDAMLDSSGRGEIWIRTGLEDSRVFIEFTDSGPGVKDGSRVFDPFYTTKPVGKGTGLGLSICYGIINEHDGEITVRNMPPRGAAFTIRLPLMPAEESESRRQFQREESPQFGRILLVDDESAVLELEQEILNDRCQWVGTATSAAEAMQILAREPVDLVVTDLKMPGEISGIEFYRWIQSTRPELAARVIFSMSGARTDGVAELLAESGCRHIQKPFQVAKFLEVIRQVLEQPAAPALKR